VVFSIVLLCNRVGLYQCILGMYCLYKGENKGNVFHTNLNVHIKNCMVTTEHHDLKKIFCVCDICSEEKENILSLHFICSCHLDLGDGQG